MKTTDAQTNLKVMTNCPYCNRYQDIFYKGNVRDVMGDDLSAIDIEIEITCEDCRKIFIVDEIIY